MDSCASSSVLSLYLVLGRGAEQARSCQPTRGLCVLDKPVALSESWFAEKRLLRAPLIPSPLSPFKRPWPICQPPSRAVPGGEEASRCLWFSARPWTRPLGIRHSLETSKWVRKKAAGLSDKLSLGILLFLQLHPLLPPTPLTHGFHSVSGERHLSLPSPGEQDSPGQDLSHNPGA